jgi:outer membrane protein assembly factor BamB
MTAWRFRSGLVPGLTLLALLAGCSGTPENTKPKDLPDITTPIPVREVWRVGLAESDNYVFQPAVRGKTVYAAGADGEIIRIDGGKRAWSVSPVRALSGGVAASDGLVVAGTLKGEVLALKTDDGSVLWRAQVGSEVVAPAAILDDVVVVRTGDNRLYGLAARDGQRKWVYQRTNPALSVRVTVAPVVADRLVFAGYPGGKLLAINTDNGQAVWEGTVSLPKGATEIERMSDVVAAPVIGAREVCAVTHLGRVACFDLNNGSLLWARDVSSTAGLALDNKAVYVADDQGIVHAFDRTTGGTLWKQDKLVNRRLTAPFLNQTYVVVADDQALLHVLDRETGALRGRLSLDAGRVEAQFLAYDAGFVMQARKGLVTLMQIDP